MRKIWQQDSTAYSPVAHVQEIRSGRTADKIRHCALRSESTPFPFLLYYPFTLIGCLGLDLHPAALCLARVELSMGLERAQENTVTNSSLLQLSSWYLHIALRVHSRELYHFNATFIIRNRWNMDILILFAVTQGTVLLHQIFQMHKLGTSFKLSAMSNYSLFESEFESFFSSSPPECNGPFHHRLYNFCNLTLALNLYHRLTVQALWGDHVWTFSAQFKEKQIDWERIEKIFSEVHLHTVKFWVSHYKRPNTPSQKFC